MQIGRYEVVRPLGEGGMATAYLARHPTGADVVMKIPHIVDDQTVERVRDEARMGIRLSHPNIVETLDLVEHDGKPVLVVRYIAGCTLRDWWKVGPAPASAVCHIGVQMAEALAWIHEATDEHGAPLGILHRDVAPGNILVNQEGDALLIDLGIARGSESKAQKTELGIIKGTLRYLAPEILDGKPHSTQTDIWALGVCLWELAVGRRAVRGDERAVLTAVMRGEVMKLRDNERVDERLTSMLRSMVAPVAERFTTARAAHNAFAALQLQLGDPEEGAQIARSFVSASPQADNVGEKLGPEPDDDLFAGLSSVSAVAPAADPITNTPLDPTARPATPLEDASSPPTLMLETPGLPLIVGTEAAPSPRAITFGQMAASRQEPKPDAALPGPTLGAELDAARTAPYQPAVELPPVARVADISAALRRPSRPILPIVIGALLAVVFVSALVWFVLR